MIQWLKDRYTVRPEIRKIIDNFHELETKQDGCWARHAWKKDVDRILILVGNVRDIFPEYHANLFVGGREVKLTVSEDAKICRKSVKAMKDIKKRERKDRMKIHPRVQDILKNFP